jgi:4-hydroxy-3-methylbut-2-enyl diphosphate reductase
MKVTIDPGSGFCFGVKKAIGAAESILVETGNLYCLGDIVHNQYEVKRLQTIGMVVINHDQFNHMHDCTVLIRAHGEPPETFSIAQKNNIQLIDATCPVVLALQKKIRSARDEIRAKEGQIVIFGKKDHPEVVGLTGQIENQAIIISQEEDLTRIDPLKPVRLFAQTTKGVEEYHRITGKIKEQVSDFSFTDTICRQVSGRAEQLRIFATHHDAIIFVSGKESSNGTELFRICKECNPETFRISGPEELKPEWLTGSKSVGICGATSTPIWLMERAADEIRKMSC